MLFAPLSQFEITYYTKYKVVIETFSDFYIALTDYSIASFCCLALVVYIFFFLSKPVKYSKYTGIGKYNRPFYRRVRARFWGVLLIPTRLQLIFEMIYELILASITSQAGFVGLKYLPLIFSVFLYIIGSNLIGLIPFNFTTTSQAVVPHVLAFVFNTYFLFIGMTNLGWNFIKNFIPTGVPAVLVPFIFIIELASYFLRTISLSLRLFANLLAGHILLYIIGSFVLLAYVVESGILNGFTVALYACIFLLEVMISGVQAYVFAILLTVYISDAVHVKH